MTSSVGYSISLGSDNARVLYPDTFCPGASLAHTDAILKTRGYHTLSSAECLNSLAEGVSPFVHHEGPQGRENILAAVGSQPVEWDRERGVVLSEQLDKEHDEVA